MKKILFLTLSFIFILCSYQEVHASSDTFYEAEMIPNIYLVRDDGTTKYFQQARFYRRASDQKAAYCIDPFKVFDIHHSNYDIVDKIENLSDNIKNRIRDIAGFGYGYPGHEDSKWYAVTQLMIWKEIEPTKDFYFTDTLNGNRIDAYQNEINEIETLINNSKIAPSFANNIYYGLVGQAIHLTDTNYVFSEYTIPTAEEGIVYTRINNDYSITSSKPICITQNLTRYFSYHNDPVLFYYNGNSQSLMTVGNPDAVIYPVNFCFQELTLTIKKIDSTTNDTTSPGEASLLGTTFTLYDENMNKIKDLELNENLEVSISSRDSNINYGKYFIKETNSGIWYQENNTIYEINFSKDNTNIELIVENEVIEKELVIKKKYGDGQIMKAEEGIQFDIYDHNNHYLTTITTDSNGIAKITLPYGHYKVKQTNTTEGYTMAKEFEVFIENENKNYIYEINDYLIEEKTPTIEIEVPDTYLDKKTYMGILPLIGLIFSGYYVKKKIH